MTYVNKHTATYERNLGWLNTGRVAPIWEDSQGRAFMTKNGAPVIMPDQWTDPDDDDNFWPGEYVPLEHGTLAYEFLSDDKLRVIE